MITTKPVGDWTWEVTSDTGTLRPGRAADVMVAVWDELTRHELAVPVGKARVSVRPIDDMRNARIDVGGLPLGREPQARGAALSHVMAEAASLDGDFLVTIRTDCPGLWLESESGTRHRAEKLFVIHVDIWKGALLSVTLETYSDAWLTMDTRDREQPEVFAANAPRLATALDGISRLLGGPPEPGEPNCFATATVTGFEDPRVEGTAYDDSWGTFEVPARGALLHTGGPDSEDEDEYEEVTDQPVRYFPVLRDGQTLGYVWAAVGEQAAGYEPRTAAGSDAFEAGTQWLLRLREAHRRGLTALAALDWVVRQPLRTEMGSIVDSVPSDAQSLDALQEPSGRY